MRRRASIVAWVEGVDVTVGELFPAFTRELQSLAVQEGRPDLAEQIPNLPVVARCKCGDDNCAHFYTAPLPPGPYLSGHTCLPLPSLAGLVVLDLVNDRIVAIEVLDRPDVKPALDRLLPPTR
jgi:hypothetical protein